MNILKRRSILGGIGALALGLVSSTALAQERTSIRIGYAISQTGQNSAGASSTTIPNYKLWQHDINAAGGMLMPDGTRLPLEMIAYDDRSQTEDVVRAIERLATQDKVDFILPPWGTGFNLAVAPLMARYGYPQLATTSVVSDASKFTSHWPTSFWFLGQGGDYIHALTEVLKSSVASGELNGKVAMLSIADGFGIELVGEARKSFAEAGFEILLDKTYPLGTQNFNTLISEAEGTGADIFVALSYPGDTFAITKQATLAKYNPKVFVTGVGTNFPIYPVLNNGNVEGVMSLGGIDRNSKLIKGYRDHFVKVIEKEPDSWACPVIYTSLQMLEQSIARRGLDRAAVTDELSNGSFETVLGTVKMENNQLRKLWWIGQWQDGVFAAIAPMDRDGAASAVIPKPVWK